MSEIKVLTDLDIWGEPKRYNPTRPNPDEDETDCQEVEGDESSDSEVSGHLSEAIGGRYR
jgi:hypothetical protein